jgi:predicted AAA+ superfamily ATPase
MSQLVEVECAVIQEIVEHVALLLVIQEQDIQELQILVRVLKHHVQDIIVIVVVGQV